MITEKRIRQLEYLAFHDDMTKLYNRHFLFMEITLTDYKYLYFIDINGLKKVNESGHFTGDEHIRKIVRGIKKLLGENDLFIRYAGDEFVILSNDDNKLESNILYSVGKTKTNSKVRPTIKKANNNMLKNKHHG
jgi:diguanylate cyclase (GGDEF)-like protein